MERQTVTACNRPPLSLSQMSLFVTALVAQSSRCASLQVSSVVSLWRPCWPQWVICCVTSKPRTPECTPPPSSTQVTLPQNKTRVLTVTWKPSYSSFQRNCCHCAEEVLILRKRPTCQQMSSISETSQLSRHVTARVCPQKSRRLIHTYNVRLKH